jgi:drug/metabolite transporter (DMT)-like permease
MGYVYIFSMVLLTVYAQLILKWRVDVAGGLPADFSDKLSYLARLVTNPWVISGLSCGFLAFLCWTLALSYFELSFAYPFTSLSFVLVLVLSVLFFGETPTPTKVIGILLILVGLFVSSRG